MVKYFLTNTGSFSTGIISGRRISVDYSFYRLSLSRYQPSN